MLNFLKSLFGITLVVLLGYGLYRVATQNADNSVNTLRVAADSTATIVGTVISNKNDCMTDEADSKCFLKLQIAGKEVYVIYNNNHLPFCSNETAAIAGKNAKEGSSVKVHGFYREDKGLDTILTCPNSNYFIQGV